MNNIVPRQDRRRLALIVGACVVMAACSPGGSAASRAGAASQEASQVDESLIKMLPLARGPEPAGEAAFIVRFVADHPLGRAQALQASGRAVEAERLAHEAIAEDYTLYGLCFQRFTVNGAEIVLAGCSAPRTGREEVFRELWLSRLADMKSVEYADVNRIAHASNRGST